MKTIAQEIKKILHEIDLENTATKGNHNLYPVLKKCGYYADDFNLLLENGSSGVLTALLQCLLFNKDITDTYLKNHFYELDDLYSAFKYDIFCSSSIITTAHLKAKCDELFRAKKLITYKIIADYLKTAKLTEAVSNILYYFEHGDGSFHDDETRLKELELILYYDHLVIASDGGRLRLF